MAGLAALGLTALGCHERSYVPPADAGPRADAAGDALTPLTLDISVTGCAAFDVTAVVCSGPAPLTVSFAPVASPTLTTFRWTFGDGTAPSTEPAPTHTYALPGSYDVGVTGQGASGTVAQVRHGLVSVLSLPTGAACDVDSQCGSGLACLCKLGSGCGAAFARGICSTACPTGFCGTGAVCAAIALGAPVPDGGPPAPVCLADCSGGAACAPGFVCQQLRSGGGASGWIDACLPLGAAGDFGSSCRDANDVLQDAACTTGFCADLGVLGMCSAPCGGGQPCPPGAACATVAGAATPLCLPACSAATPCTGDPGLGCVVAEAADAGTDGGLAISAGAPGVAYCAPESR
ncbi:MAG TPA: PKD domain-containing protein [Polyangia bacterium]|nr:PKD domain-containing protein [Polyangia bacterium]